MANAEWRMANAPACTRWRRRCDLMGDERPWSETVSAMVGAQGAAQVRRGELAIGLARMSSTHAGQLPVEGEY